MKYFLLPMLFAGLLYLQPIFAQTNTFPTSGSAGIGTLAPDASSVFEIKSTSKGILIPRMTNAQRNLITTPATGLLIYQTNSTPGFYMYNGLAWAQISAGKANSNLNNLSATTAINQSLLPGITNSIDLGSATKMWRNIYSTGDALINTVSIGRGGGSQVNNTTVGFAALGLNTSGNFNTAVGMESLNANTIGSYNTANGLRSLYSNTSGEANTAVGEESLFSNSVGNVNTAIGAGTLASNSTGSKNTANGVGVLGYNTIGNGNTGLGYFALTYNSTGNCNVAIGSNALYNSTTRSNLVAIGDSALYNNGLFATNLYEAEKNVAVGSKALFSNTIGYENVAIGKEALFNNVDGKDNTATGYAALENATGSYNTAFGSRALFNNNDGSYNTAIGYGAQFSGTSISFNNATAIGANAIVNASNKIRLGDAFMTILESAAGSWTASDGRFKTNVTDEVKGLDFINLLHPVVYNFEGKKFEQYLMQNNTDSMRAVQFKGREKSIAKAFAIRQSGFIAQEVLEAAKKAGYDFNGVHVPENPTDNYSISYEKLVVPLVKAVQELSSENARLLVGQGKLRMENEKQAAINISQQKQIDELKEAMLKIISQQKCVSTTSK